MKKIILAAILFLPFLVSTHTYLLAHDEVVGFHETVFLSEDRQHVLIKLEAEKNDEHTEEIGEGKARKLRYADMLTQ